MDEVSLLIALILKMVRVWILALVMSRWWNWVGVVCVLNAHFISLQFALGPAAHVPDLIIVSGQIATYFLELFGIPLSDTISSFCPYLVAPYIGDLVRLGVKRRL